MVTLKVRHRTTYRYGKPVAPRPHRLMLRPRERLDVPRTLPFDFHH